MSYVKIWVHIVWRTKNNSPIILNSFRGKLYQHIKEHAETKGIYIKCINGYLDHVHCLLSMAYNVDIGKTMQYLKGESSHWINKNKISPGKFEWAEDYFAVSVSESMTDKVIQYINNQWEHHKVKTFKEEYDSMINKYEFEKAGRQD